MYWIISVIQWLKLRHRILGTSELRHQGQQLTTSEFDSTETNKDGKKTKNDIFGSFYL